MSPKSFIPRWAAQHPDRKSVGFSDEHMTRVTRMTDGKNTQLHRSPLDAGHAPVCVYLCEAWNPFHIPHQDAITVPTQQTCRQRVISPLVIAQPPDQPGSAQSRGSGGTSPGMGLGYVAWRGQRETPYPCAALILTLGLRTPSSTPLLHHGGSRWTWKSCVNSPMF